MTGRAPVIVRLREGEASALADLVEQLTEMLTHQAEGDPAITRLTPDAYPDDRDASREFRRATRDDLLERRTGDAATVAASLAPAGGDDGARDATREIALAPDEVDAWMRTLTALRLVIATRLGIRDDDDGDRTDPLYGAYDWLGFRLEMLIAAADA